MGRGRETRGGYTRSGFFVHESEPQQTGTRGIVTYQEVEDERGGSKLSHCAMEIFKKLGFGGKIDLDAVRVHIGFSPAVQKFLENLPGGADATAMTWKNDIYYKDWANYKPTTVAGLASIGHELAHVLQWARYGDNFYELYAGAWMRNGGYNRNMQFEKVPYQIQDDLKVKIEKEFGKDPCKNYVQEIQR